MRLIITMTLPNDPINAMMKAGTFGPTMGRILAEIKPEAAYFTTVDGQRGGYIIVNVDDVSKVPSIAEPLFLAFNAKLDWNVAMTPEDLMKADADIAQAAKNYG